MRKQLVGVATVGHLLLGSQIGLYHRPYQRMDGDEVPGDVELG